MTVRSNSAAARDIAHHLHSYNQRQEERGGRLAGDHPRKGVYIYDGRRQGLSRGHVGPVVPVAGLMARSAWWRQAANQMRKLPYYHTFTQKVADVTIDLAEKLVGMAPVAHVEGLFLQLRFRGQRHDREDGCGISTMLWAGPRKRRSLAASRAITGLQWQPVSLTGLPMCHNDFDLRSPISCIRIARTTTASANPAETEEQFATRMAESLEQMILAEGPDYDRRLHCRAVMGAGGVIIP